MLVAEAMERVYARALEEHAADLAHHLYQAGAAADPEKTVRYLALAGNCAACHPSSAESGFPAFTDFGYVAIGVPRS